MSGLYNLIERFPKGINGYPWDIDELSGNPYLPLELIEDYPEGINGKNWNMIKLSSNPAITADFIRTHTNGIWNNSWVTSGLSKNPSIDMQLVLDNPDGFDMMPWNFYCLASNPALTKKFVMDNIGLFLEFDRQNNKQPIELTAIGKLASNPIVNEEIVLSLGFPIIKDIIYNNVTNTNNKNIIEYMNFVYDEAIGNQMLQQMDHPNNELVTWSLEILAGNQSINPEFIKSNLDPIVDMNKLMEKLSMNSSLTLDFVLKNPDGLNGVPWNMKILSSNQIITVEFIENYPMGFGSGPWCLTHLSDNPNITREFIDSFGISIFWKLFVYTNKRYKYTLLGYFIRKIPGLATISNLLFDFYLNIRGSKSFCRYCDFTSLSKFCSLHPVKLLNDKGIDYKFINNNINFTSWYDYYHSLVASKSLTLDFVENYPKFSLLYYIPYKFLSKPMFGGYEHNNVYSSLCSYDYILEHPEGYYQEATGKIIPWDMKILSSRSWITPLTSKSSRKY